MVVSLSRYFMMVYRLVLTFFGAGLCFKLMNCETFDARGNFWSLGRKLYRNDQEETYLDACTFFLSFLESLELFDSVESLRDNDNADCTPHRTNELIGLSATLL